MIDQYVIMKQYELASSLSKDIWAMGELGLKVSGS